MEKSTKTSLFITGAAVVLLVIAAFWISRTPSSPLSVGSGSAQDHSFHEFFNRGLTVGGKYSTSTTASTYTTGAKDFPPAVSIIDWNPSTNAITVSISGTSTLGLVPKIGDVSTIYLRNSGTANITLAAADSGSEIKTASSTKVIAGSGYGKLVITHVTQNLISVLLSSFF